MLIVRIQKKTNKKTNSYKIVVIEKFKHPKSGKIKATLGFFNEKKIFAINIKMLIELLKKGVLLSKTIVDIFEKASNTITNPKKTNKTFVSILNNLNKKNTL